MALRPEWLSWRTVEELWWLRADAFLPPSPSIFPGGVLCSFGLSPDSPCKIKDVIMFKQQSLYDTSAEQILAMFEHNFLNYKEVSY